MTKRNSNFDHWSYQETWAERGDEDSLCFLDLRARVEALEKRCAVQLMQLSNLQERHHRLAIQTRHLESELYTDDEPEQHCVEALEDISKPTPNSRQIRISLVERVRNAISSEYDPKDYCWDEARAAIREVAAWLQERSESNPGARLLDLEAKSTSQEDYDA